MLFPYLYCLSFEVSESEKPLTINYLEVQSANSKTNIDLKVSFANREVSILNQNKVVLLEWNKLNDYLSIIYNCEFIEEQASRKLPSKVGKYLNIGDGHWYEFGKSLQKMKGNPTSLESIEQIFKSDL